MKKTLAVSPKQIPPRLPFVLTAVAWLLLDRLQASDLICGVVYTLLAIWWCACLYAVYVYDPVTLPLETWDKEP